MLNAHEDRNKERFDTVARTTRLAADTLDIRLQSMNEFRASLTDQNLKFITRDVYETEHRSLGDIVRMNATRIADLDKILNSIQVLKSERRSELGSSAMMFAMAGVVFSIIVSLITVAFNFAVYIHAPVIGVK
jgi:hypothetical protein